MPTRNVMFRAILMVLFVSGLVLSLGVLPGQVARAEHHEDILPLSINATAPNLADVGRAGRGDSAFLEIRISKWTSDEDRDAVIEALKANPTKGVVNALEKMYQVGTIRDIQTMSEPLRYAHVEPTEGGGHEVILASDRPMNFVEMWTGERMPNYSITVIELTLGPDNRGTGKIMLGAALKWDEENGKIAVAKLATDPIKLIEVGPRGTQ